MRSVSFINHGGSRFTCRENGLRFAIVQIVGEGYRVYINECPDVTRPTRKAALERIEQEARVSLL